jgi:hypothetical protein
MWAVILTIIMLIGSAYLIRNGYNWIRWAIAVVLLPGIIFMPFSLSTIFKDSIAGGLFSILQSIIQAIATTVLFIPYKLPVNAPADNVEV